MPRKMLLLLAAVVAVVGLTIAGCGTATKADSKGVQKAAREAGESKAVQEAREAYDSSKGVRQHIRAKRFSIVPEPLRRIIRQSSSKEDRGP
jgi:hypothetical protein